MIVLMGKSCSGKTSVLQELVEMGYQRTVTYTTRPKRPLEINGKDYIFLNDDYFESLLRGDFFAETDSFKTADRVWKYGSSRASYENSDNRVIILTPQGIRHIKDKYPNLNMTVVYLKTPEYIIWSRMKMRGDNMKEGLRRLIHDRNDFKNAKELADVVIMNDGSYSISDIAKKIRRVLLLTTHGLKTDGLI